MKKIDLGRGLFALVDDCDFETLNKVKWITLKHRTGKCYAVANVRGKSVLMHRLILDVVGFENKVDHINRDTLDNRRINLRICTNSQNMMNRGISSGSKTGYKGVIKMNDRNTKQWKAQITSSGKVTCIGYFKTAEQAAAAYNEKAKELHGEFAYLNSIP